MRPTLALRLAGLCAGSALLAACGFLPPSQQQEFTVSSAVTAAQPTPFNNNVAGINDTLARNYCADGYDHLDDQKTTISAGTVSTWRVSCAVHNSLPDF